MESRPCGLKGKMAEQIKRTVVVTGGSRGIGRAICLGLAGPNTVLYFNHSAAGSAARETERLVNDSGGHAVGFQADVSSEPDVSRFFKEIIHQTGRIDVLVNNAGISRDGLVVRMKQNDWDDVININLKGCFNCVKIAARSMIRQRSGCIVNITSIVGVTGNTGQANYAASKAGIIGLTKSLARELAPKGITVNAVAPGFVETDMTANLSNEIKGSMLDQIPLGRACTPGDVSAAVEFLVSESASYITGQVIHVNGGMYM